MLRSLPPSDGISVDLAVFARPVQLKLGAERHCAVFTACPPVYCPRYPSFRNVDTPCLQEIQFSHGQSLSSLTAMHPMRWTEHSVTVEYGGNNNKIWKPRCDACPISLIDLFFLVAVEERPPLCHGDSPARSEIEHREIGARLEHCREERSCKFASGISEPLGHARRVGEREKRRTRDASLGDVEGFELATDPERDHRSVVDPSRVEDQGLESSREEVIVAVLVKRDGFEKTFEVYRIDRDAGQIEILAKER